MAGYSGTKRRAICAALSLWLKMSIVEFDGTTYSQVGGIPTGKRASPLLAIITMADGERQILHRLNDAEKITFKRYYRRFIDDGWVIWPSNTAHSVPFFA